MRIYEIISEETVTPGGIIIPDQVGQGSRAARAAKAAAQVTPTAASRAAGAAKNVASKAVDITKAKVSAGAQASWLKTKAILKTRLFPQSIKLRNGATVDITNPSNLTGILGNKAARGLVGIAGTTLTILKWMGFINFVYQWWGTKALIHDMASGPNPEINPNDEDVMLRLAFEDLVAEFAASEIMVRFITWAIRLFRMGRIAEVAAGTVLGFLSGGTIIGAEVAFFLAQEVLIIALQNWLQSAEGKDLIAKIVISAIDPALTAVYDNSIGQFTGKLKQLSGPDAEKKAQDVLSKPTQTATGAALGKPSPAATASAPQGNADVRANNDAVDQGQGGPQNATDFSNVSMKHSYGDVTQTGQSDADRAAYFKKNPAVSSYR